MQIDRDVPVPTRDGTPIVVDVFRPDDDGPVPVIASISPYGKDVHRPDRYPQYENVPHHEHMVPPIEKTLRWGSGPLSTFSKMPSPAPRLPAPSSRTLRPPSRPQSRPRARTG